MISFSNIGKSFGPQILFNGVSFQFNPGNRYGLVGANGCGKSTFLKMISGQENASEGTISRPKKLQLGVLKQDHFEYEDVPILHVVMMGNEELWSAMDEKEKLLEQADENFDTDRYAEVEDVILRHDGYSLEARAGEILEGLGIPTESHRQNLSTLSGGFKLRALLAQVLAAGPDCLLLDEPTNHLDILSIRWLEKFLVEYPGLAVVISHDHRFLDNVCNHIVDVDYETILLYPGNYQAFLKAKQAERDRKEAEIGKREKQIADHQAFIDRFKAKASKARQAQSKMKQMEKIVIDRLPMTSRRYPTFRFDARRPSGKKVLEVEGLTKSFGPKKVLENVSLTIDRGDRLAIIGPNGIGKSTFLKILMDIHQPDSGTFEWGYETHPGYFAQDHKDLLVPPQSTVEGWLWDICPAEPIGFVRGKLGMVLFLGDEVKKKLGSLSGGESARLIFASLGVKQPNVLLLDEPTNHLDLEAIEALVAGLRKFEGTLILVSHDRWFVSQLANRILEISPNGIQDVRGTYEEYVERCGDDHLDTETAVLKARRDKKKNRAPVSDLSEKEKQKRHNKLKKQRDSLTADIESTEERINAINEKFCNPGFFDKTSEKETRKLENEQKDLASRVDELMATWEQVEEDLGKLADDS